MARRGGETRALRIAAPIIRPRARWLRALADVAAQQTRFLAPCAPAVTSMAGAHGVQTRIPQRKNAGHRALIRQDRRVFGQARRAEKTSRYASLRCLIRSLRRRSFVSCRVMFFSAFSFRLLIGKRTSNAVYSAFSRCARRPRARAWSRDGLPRRLALRLPCPKGTAGFFLARDISAPCAMLELALCNKR